MLIHSQHWQKQNTTASTQSCLIFSHTEMHVDKFLSQLQQFLQVPDESSIDHMLHDLAQATGQNYAPGAAK